MAPFNTREIFNFICFYGSVDTESNTCNIYNFEESNYSLWTEMVNDVFSWLFWKFFIYFIPYGFTLTKSEIHLLKWPISNLFTDLIHQIFDNRICWMWCTYLAFFNSKGRFSSLWVHSDGNYVLWSTFQDCRQNLFLMNLSWWVSWMGHFSKLWTVFPMYL